MARLAIYGSVGIRREFCHGCRDFALILDARFACCDRAIGDRSPEKYERMSASSGIRKRPDVSARRAILAAQRNRCFYCGSVFGDVAYAGSKRRGILVNWDHVEPFCWQSNNQRLNFVAACSICNGIKGSRVFPSKEDAIAYVWKRRKVKGWTSATEEHPDSEMRSVWRAIPPKET